MVTLCSISLSDAGRIRLFLPFVWFSKISATILARLAYRQCFQAFSRTFFIWDRTGFDPASQVTVEMVREALEDAASGKMVSLR